MFSQRDTPAGFIYYIVFKLPHFTKVYSINSGLNGPKLWKMGIFNQFLQHHSIHRILALDPA